MRSEKIVDVEKILCWFGCFRKGSEWNNIPYIHYDVIKWKHFPRNWPFVRRIHRSPVNSPHKGQWRRALMFPLICVWINDWVNNREAGDLRRHLDHYDVSVMIMGGWSYQYSNIMSHRICTVYLKTSNYIPQILRDVITCSCPWYLLLAHKSSIVPRLIVVIIYLGVFV